MPAASPSPINLLLTQFVSEVAGRRVVVVIFLFFFLFPILKNRREQSFASAEMQLPLERHMVAISHQVQVHHQSREVRWSKCSS